MAAQRSTCTHIKITTTADARVIFHAVFMNVLPMITRRLDNTERSHILPGDVYVWEERGANTETSGVSVFLSFPAYFSKFVDWHRTMD